MEREIEELTRKILNTQAKLLELEERVKALEEGKATEAGFTVTAIPPPTTQEHCKWDEGGTTNLPVRLFIEGKRLWEKCDRLYIEGHRLMKKANKLTNEGNRNGGQDNV